MVSKILQTTLLLILIIVLFILKEAGVFHQITPHFDGEVIAHDSPTGLEDITTDLTKGIAYISSHNRRSFSENGMIYKTNLFEKSLKLESIIDTTLPFPFRPHGISLYHHSDGNKYLFVVNHEDEVNSVLRFKIGAQKLIFEKRFVHELIKFPNDVTALGLNTFYITNDHTIPNGLRRMIGDFAIEKSGNVVFYKEGEAGVVTQDIAYANGVNLSPDGKYLYVASTTENTLFVYQHSKELTPRILLDQKYLSTAPDNIEIDKFGDLWIGCHPKLLNYLGHAKNEKKRSPSEIIKLVYQPEMKHKFLQEEVYMNNGDPISGSSVASYFLTDSSNTILLGSVFENKLIELHRKL